MRALRWGALVVAFTLLLAATAQAGTVSVRRTANGVPHIVASNYRDLGYGLGYSYAQDNFCLLADTIVTVSGERSRYFGPDANYRSYALSQEVNNLKSDFFFTDLNRSGTLERLLALKPPRGPSREQRAIVAGYAAGYNRYLARTGRARLPAACRNAPWVRPITALDIQRRLYQLSLFASSLFFLQNYVDATPPALGTSASARTTFPDRLPPGALPNHDSLKLGSNAIALGGDATANRRGMLLGNPHFPWDGPERFYEMHLTIPGKLDVAGGALGGFPGVNIGHTRGLAWSHTVSTAFRFTPYELHLVPGDPTSYTYDGKTEKMTTRTVEVQARTASGALEKRSHTFYFSRFGRMVEAPDIFLTWGTANAYAIRDANADNVRIADQFLAMNRAQSVADLKRAQSYWQGIPWVNTIAADSKGHAYYADQSVVPNVPDALSETCVDSAVGKAVQKLGRLPILDGSRADCNWGTDPDAVVPGIFGPSHLPRLDRTDYVENSNDSYWLSNPHRPLEGFASIIGDERTKRNMRTRLGLKMIEGRLAGTDGLPGKGFTLDKLQTIAFNNRNYTGEILRDDLVAMCRRTPLVATPDGKLVDISEACPVLERWDLHGNLDSRGEALWHLFVTNVLNTTMPFFARDFDVNDPINTPSGLNPANVETIQGLAQAVQYLRDHQLPLDVPWGKVHVSTNGGRPIPIHGCDDYEGCFHVTANYNVKDPLVVDFGSSYVMAVSFTDRGPVGRALVTYGQSTDPASPYRNDQTKLFSAKKWRPMLFTAAELRRAPATKILRLRTR
ncbi:MAG: acyl-homoserine-lactone acylase [Solirubrobacteraceae bacterium]|nr:acyl-homoserine-lactone acylase [Solirubrobacteraceae bacterium]